MILRSRLPSFVSSILLGVGNLYLLLPSCQAAELLPSTVMNLAVLGAQVSDLIYDTVDAAAYAARYPVPVKTRTCTNGVCKTITTYRSGLFSDGPNVALAAKVGSVCVMAFRGTTNTQDPMWTQDMASNLLVQQTTLLGQCTVNSGIRDAYYAPFRADLEASVRGCMSNCAGCSLLITGHSQGGSIANVAGVLFASYGYSPYVMTYGQPKVLGSRCQVNGYKWYRFIGAIPGMFRLNYDVVPMLPGTGYFFGHEFVVSSDDATGVDYIGVNQHVQKSPVSVAAHYIGTYLASLTAVRNNGYPIDTTGFRNGAQCTVSSECNSGSCAWRWWDAAYEC